MGRRLPSLRQLSYISDAKNLGKANKNYEVILGTQTAESASIILYEEKSRNQAIFFESKSGKTGQKG